MTPVQIAAEMLEEAERRHALMMRTGPMLPAWVRHQHRRARDHSIIMATSIIRYCAGGRVREEARQLLAKLESADA